jgi:hypothetical protein
MAFTGANMTKLGILWMGSTLLLGAAQTYSGVVTDSMCARDHSGMGVKPNAKCVQECVKHGSKYALATADKVYLLSDQRTPEKFAAAKVIVTGTLDPKTNTIAVEKIEPAR